jgi:ribosomal protein L11 methyltransferase
MERYHLLLVSSKEEAVIGILSAFDFESFEERDEETVAYMPESGMRKGLKENVARALEPMQYTHRWDVIEPQNWNALWEASFQPVRVGDFCLVRALFHPPDESVKYDLVIQPKMAFGTGHHATTNMMIQWMESIDFQDKSVFDFGCGTGILAILACKMGADQVDAVDIEEESYLNTQENALMNQVGCVVPYCGDLESLPERKYDIIFANINRNILLKYAGQLRQRMHPSGILIWSGVLEEDLNTVSDSFLALGFQEEGRLHKTGWGAVKMKV